MRYNEKVRNLKDTRIKEKTYKVEKIENAIEDCYSEDCFQEATFRYSLQNEYKGVFCCKKCAVSFLK